MVPDWKNADPASLEPFYTQWVGLLTTEGLHAKADIATVLAMLTRERYELREALREGIEAREQVGYMRQMAALQVWEERSRRLIDKGE